MSAISRYLSPEAAQSAAEAIQDADGNEVFMVGYLNDDLVVESVEVFGRGNEVAAPALLQVARPGDVVIHNHPSGTLQPSHADLDVAAILGNESVGFYIVNNPVTDVFVVVEPFCIEAAQPVDEAAIVGLFQPGGPVSRQLPQFEFRPPQLEMIRVVSRAINEDKIALVEAGTGTGKTFAYLFPAISHALANKERVVVSTNTINLQEQIIHKDLPILQAILPSKFRAVLVKGRSNYACKRKLREAQRDLNLFSEEGDAAELRALLEWAKTTADGSRSDLNFEPRPQVWEKIQSESDTTLRTRCPFYNECFFYQARRRAAGAEVLVANHHLLFSDLALRAAVGASENAILPKYHRIVFDEAHNLEEVATQYFGSAVTYLGTRRILGRLFRRRGDRERGQLVYLLNKLNKLSRGRPADAVAEVQRHLREHGIAGIQRLDERLSEVMEPIYTRVRSDAEAESGETKVRLTPERLETPDWQAIRRAAQVFVRETRSWNARLAALLHKLEDLRRRLGWSTLSLTIDVQAQANRLLAAAQTLEHILLESTEADVRWVEVREGYRQAKIVRLRSAPLDVAPLLKNHVFGRFNNVVLTSATLTVEGKFDYLKSRLGLDRFEPRRLIEAALPSVFDFEKQVLVGVPRDLPDPRDREFAEALPEIVVRAVDTSHGRAFVLFTAYGLLNRVFQRAQAAIEALGFHAYRQGQESRHRLLERFKQDPGSVLFATDSFWEGVDVPGAALENVIIVKLPFRVPTEPVVQARVEALERDGRNAFLEYSVPQAVIKFRQGFGRLIRHKHDRGCVLILDKRVVQMRYGRAFLESLPRCRTVTGSTDQVLREMARFFGPAEKPLATK